MPYCHSGTLACSSSDLGWGPLGAAWPDWDRGRLDGHWFSAWPVNQQSAGCSRTRWRASRALGAFRESRDSRGLQRLLQGKEDVSKKQKQKQLTVRGLPIGLHGERGWHGDTLSARRVRLTWEGRRKRRREVPPLRGKFGEGRGTLLLDIPAVSLHYVVVCPPSN